MKARSYLPAQLGKFALDVLFTLGIPLAILNSPLRRLSGFPHWSGAVLAYLLSALVPVGYILIDTLRSRTLNPVSLVLASLALLGGGLAFLRISGPWFAAKESAHAIFLAAVTLGSLLRGRPLAGTFVRVVLVPRKAPAQQAALKVLHRPEIQRSLMLATGLVCAKSLLLALITFLATAALVTAPFGSARFDAELVTAHLRLAGVSLITDTLGYGSALVVVEQALRKHFGFGRLLGGEFWKG